MNLRRALGLTAVLSIAAAAPALAQPAAPGPLSAVAKENLQKPRPKAPVDLTGTYSMVIDEKTGRHQFLPLPKLTPSAAAMLAKVEDYSKRGFEYRDDPGACWPLGVPRIMTRFWPIQIIQLPTMIQLTTYFDNDVRWIYMDGRPHPKEQDLEIYNGHSIGKWEGDTLVVDTVGMTDDHHWIQEGIPASTKLHVVERMKLVDGGKALEIQFTMTDPDNWEGEWVNTKRYNRADNIDIQEHNCIYELMRELPSFRANIRE